MRRILGWCAIAMSLAIVGTVSLLLAIPHWKLGNVRLKTAGLFGLSTMLGAYTGARLATLPFITDTLRSPLVVSASPLCENYEPSHYFG